MEREGSSDSHAGWVFACPAHTASEGALQCSVALNAEIIDFLLSAMSSFITSHWLFLTQVCQVCHLLLESVLQSLIKSAVDGYEGMS